MKKLILIVTSILICVSMYAQEQPTTPNLAATPVVQDIGVVQLMDKYFTQISNLVKSAEQPVKELYAGLVKQVQFTAKVNLYLSLCLLLITIFPTIFFCIRANEGKWKESVGFYCVMTILGSILTLIFLGVFIAAIYNYILISANPEWYALQELLTIIQR